MNLRTFVCSVSLLVLPVVASASDYGCEALLCFAGGKNVAECQGTINKVLKDLARGKSFPSCTMAGNGSSPINVITKKKRGKVKSVDLYIDPSYAVDPNHQHQRFNF